VPEAARILHVLSSAWYHSPGPLRSSAH